MKIREEVRSWGTTRIKRCEHLGNAFDGDLTAFKTTGHP